MARASVEPQMNVRDRGSSIELMTLNHSILPNENTRHRRRKVYNIGGGARLRILRGGGKGGQIPSRHMTS